jgi:hypothetical protein
MNLPDFLHKSNVTSKLSDGLINSSILISKIIKVQNKDNQDVMFK